MSLDCTTPRGLVYIAAQMNCLQRLEETWSAQIFPTIEDDAADIDAIAVKGGHVSAVMEIKSREMGLDQLHRFGSYLITFEKLLKLRRTAAALRVPRPDCGLPTQRSSCRVLENLRSRGESAHNPRGQGHPDTGYVQWRICGSL